MNNQRALAGGDDDSEALRLLGCVVVDRTKPAVSCLFFAWTDDRDVAN